MKKRFFLSLCALIASLALVPPARADGSAPVATPSAAAAPAPAATPAPSIDTPLVDVPGYPKTATGLDIAFAYSWLTQTPPPFEQWARFTDGYAKASEYEKGSYIQSETQALLSQYQLMTSGEPLSIAFVAQLAPYSADNGGYVVKNFTDDTYFPFSFAGRDYAVIPQGLTDHQWLAITDLAQKDVEAAVQASPDRKVRMVLRLKPSYTDPKAPQTQIEGKLYTLISTTIADLQIYSCAADLSSCHPVWGEHSKVSTDDNSQELFNLKQ